MKITLLSTFDINGGAPLAAYRLLKGLKEIHPDAAMMVQVKSSEDPAVYRAKLNSLHHEVEIRIFDRILKKEIMNNRTKMSETWFSIPYPGYDLSGTTLLRESDIINLHWVAGFQSVETVSKLLELNIPVVWTLHDENAYTGGCHYTAGCENYCRDCKDCPQLSDNRYQLPFLHLSEKIRLWKKNLTIVTPSKWLAESAKKSRLFGRFRVEVIPNSLETDIFRPHPKEEARKKIGLEPGTQTLLFGAHTETEKRKGFSKLVKALEYCLSDDRFKKLAADGGIKILTFGPPQNNGQKHLGVEIKPMGYIDDPEKLSEVYSAADIFVLPSLEDNLPNTMLEAMACGTPVIGFRVGGIPDMVKNGVTGYTAARYNSSEMGRQILKLMWEPGLRQEMNRNCRRLIEEKFKLKDQAEAYTALFNDLRKNKKVGTGEAAKKKKSGKTIREPETVDIEEWETPVQDGYFNIYRKIAVDALVERQEQVFTLKDELVRQDKIINEIHAKLLERKEQMAQQQQQFLSRIAQFQEKNRQRAAQVKETLEKHRRQVLQFQEKLQQRAVQMKETQEKHRLQVLQFQEKLRQSAAQLQEVEEQQRRLEEQNNELRRELREKEQRIAKILGSYTYRAGKALTYPARLLRNLYRRMKKKAVR